MARLEELVSGASVLGIDPQGPVVIIATQWFGDGVVEVAWKNSSGALGTELIYREREPELAIQQKGLPWSFDADGAQLRLVSEAWRIHYAHLFDPYLAVHTSDVEPLPHQISAVYKEMLGRLPLRYVLADDPGAGKTIMTGLFIKELAARGDLARCLIVCPGSLAEQWQDELFRKFHLRFEIITNDKIESSVTGNVFGETPLAIARLDKLARNDELREKLKNTDWDLIVCDEAHKMSATIFDNEVKMTKRFQLGRLLSGITRHFLLLTATPHNGKEEDFQLFLSLVDPDRFGGVARTGAQSVNVSDIMRRLVKEELLKFDGKPLFPDRHAITLNYDLSDAEAALYEAVTEYVRTQFNQADNLDNKRKATVGFALTILQRRLASSPEAIYQSLKRRRERLEKRLAEEKLGHRVRQLEYEDIDEDEMPSAELEETEEEIADRASASSTIAELEAEIAALARLEKMAHEVRAGGRDRKWEELSGLLQEEARMFDAGGSREKLIIFTEHRDTLRYLAEKIGSLLGNPEYVAVIYGGMGRDERRKVEERFKQDKLTRVLVATDAAGEGLNLQRAHLMVNYDLPWNPNRLEQRFGRIHRIGQPRTCWLWNLVASETREGAVFQRLFAKLEQEKNALGGKVFDILGKVSFNNRPLRELLIDAVRHGGEEENQATIERFIDAALDTEALRALLREYALTEDVMDAALVANLREEMERMEARRLQPHFIEAFFREAFKNLGGKMAAREKGRYEITYVPARLRARDMQIGSREPVLQRYERVCFDKAYAPGAVQASLLCPGHPLLEAVLGIMRERGGNILKRGAILIDENEPDENLRLLFYIDAAIQDGTITTGANRRVISRQIHFVELGEDGTARNAGYAPYLDYRAARGDEQNALLAYAKNLPWLCQDVEKLAIAYAIKNLVPRHLEETRKRKLALVDKTEKAVRERLTAEIQYWDFRASDLRQKENAGKRNSSLNSAQASRRAEDLAARLQKRLDELARERQISPLPPHIAGGALIVPAGLLRKLTGKSENSPDNFTADAKAKKVIEQAAMQAVMAIERKLGFAPRDVSADKCGYDVESHIPENLRSASGESLRFIEVKGRAKGADTVTVSRNEILCALNQPEQFILALAEVDGDKTSTIYLKKPFKNPPDFSVQSSTFNIAALLKNAEKVFEG